MKDKRTIKVKNPKLQKIRNELRNVGFAAKSSQWRKYFDELEKIRKTERGYWRKNYTQKQLEKKHELVVKQRELDRLVSSSICKCPSCNASGRDMIYNRPLDMWYCTDCFQGMIDFYHATKKKLARGQFFDDFNEEFYKTFLD